MDISTNIILIICATLIALVAIVCDYLVERKSSNPSEGRLSKKIVKVHRNYIAGFLGFAVIMLLTAKFGGSNEGVFTYLSFASTITSLVLSILAIFVTVHSSSDLYKQFTRIDSATDAIGKSLEKFTEVERKLESTSNNISFQMTNIVNEIDKRLDKRMQELSDQVESSLNQHNQAINENLPKIYKEATEQVIKINQEIGQNWLDGFINSMSFNGILALYSSCLSNEKTKPFKMTDFFKGNYLYAFGILIACSSMGLILTKIDDGDTVECLSSNLPKVQLLARIKELIPKFTDAEKQLVNTINVYFNEPLI